MKKILFISITLIFLVSCSQQSDLPPEEQTTPQDINVDQETEDQLTVIEVTEEDAIERANTENDAALYEERDQAGTTLSDCNDFQDESSKQVCIDQVIMDEALSSKNASRCNDISSEDVKEICLREASNF